jgi:hypothetical protein
MGNCCRCPEVIDGSLGKRRPAAHTAETENLHALHPQRLDEAAILRINGRQLSDERVSSRLSKEMMVCKIHADEADARGSHLNGQAQGDLRRVLRVMQHTLI